MGCCCCGGLCARRCSVCAEWVCQCVWRLAFPIARAQWIAREPKLRAKSPRRRGMTPPLRGQPRHRDVAPRQTPESPKQPSQLLKVYAWPDLVAPLQTLPCSDRLNLALPVRMRPAGHWFQVPGETAFEPLFAGACPAARDRLKRAAGAFPLRGDVL